MDVMPSLKNVNSKVCQYHIQRIDLCKKLCCHKDINNVDHLNIVVSTYAQ